MVAQQTVSWLAVGAADPVVALLVAGAECIRPRLLVAVPVNNGRRVDLRLHGGPVFGGAFDNPPSLRLRPRQQRPDHRGGEKDWPLARRCDWV